MERAVAGASLLALAVFVWSVAAEPLASGSTERRAYVPPPPGSYELPAIDRVADRALVASDGRATRLFAETGGRLAVVAFVYRSCADAEGCPLSMATLHRLDRELAADPGLAAAARLLTVSFDPHRDTPGALAKWREGFAPRSDWRFLTTANEADLAALLEDFGQSAARLEDSGGRWTGLYRHVLKVFLLDGAGRVRNIYSVGFLDSELILNDLRTLREESTFRR